MKKLLSLLGSGLLALTGTTTTLACYSSIHYDDVPKDGNEDGGKDDKDDNKDIEIFNQIIAMAKTGFQELLFKDVVLGNTVNLLKTYQWVNKDQSSITLQANNVEHQYLINYFLAMFRTVYNDVNQQIINQYSNYYANSNPLTFNENDYIISINFIDLKQINEKLGLDISEIEKVKAVSVDFNIGYNVNFKSFMSPQTCQANFNMTNDVNIFSKLYDGSFIYFQNNLLQWLSDIQNVKLNEGYFKELYDAFKIDFGMDDSALDLKYKATLKEFIKTNQKLQQLNITYNEQNSFASITESLIEYHRPTDKGFDWDYLLRNRLKKWGGDSPTTAKAEDFIQNYKEHLVPKLNVSGNAMLNLATLILKLDYINIYGMTLKGYVKDSQNVTFKTVVTLSAPALDTKLLNFGNLIIAFLEYYHISYDGIRFNFQVNEDYFNQIVNNGLKNRNILESLFSFFKASKVAKTLPDLELFNFTQIAMYTGSDFNYDGASHLIFSSPNPGGFDATFVFGATPSAFYYLPFHKFFSNPSYEDQYGIQKI